MLEESLKEKNLSKIAGRGVYLIAWLWRYRNLFESGDPLRIGCFFYMGGCRDSAESLFCRFLARLPADVVIFCPDLRKKCCLEDHLLYEIHYDESLEVSAYPDPDDGMSMGTASYHAERDLDSSLYGDGFYRNQQYSSAVSLILKTAYEEISVLWDEDLKYRPNFSVRNGTVTLPVIFAVVNGVKDGSVHAYWDSIRKLITPDTAVIRAFPHLSGTSRKKLKSFTKEFFINGRLQKPRIKALRAYQYGSLREPMQDYLLDCLQKLIDQKIIKGTGENGMEHTVIAVALNLEKDILRMIQRFDFTRKNPKLICIAAGETALSLEDDITLAFLSQIGFDVVIFAPTGYQCAERHFNRSLAVSHQIGGYMFDLEVPAFRAALPDPNRRLPRLSDLRSRCCGKIFGGGAVSSCHYHSSFADCLNAFRKRRFILLLISMDTGLAQTHAIRQLSLLTIISDRPFRYRLENQIFPFPVTAGECFAGPVFLAVNYCGGRYFRQLGAMIRMTGQREPGVQDGRAGSSYQNLGGAADRTDRQDSEDSLDFPGYGQDFSFRKRRKFLRPFRSF